MRQRRACGAAGVPAAASAVGTYSVRQAANLCAGVRASGLRLLQIAAWRGR